MKFLTLTILGLLFIGCTHPAPYLFGQKSCNQKGKAAYVYANSNAAVCLSEKSVAYIICARELGMSSQSNNSSTSATIDVTASGKLIAGGISIDNNNSNKTIYESIGILAKARASAINMCVDMYKTYP